MLVMNGNYPRKSFLKHEILLHNLITGFCSELIEKVDARRALENQVTLSWCHLMATLVGMTFPVIIVDGYWCQDFQHSWVQTKWGNIIDVSPIACRSLPIMYPGNILKDKDLDWKRFFL